jgi:hypothetical protein
MRLAVTMADPCRLQTKRLLLRLGIPLVTSDRVVLGSSPADRQQGRPESRTPASGAVWSNWGGSPSDEEPGGRSLRTLARGDQMQ